MIELDQGLFKWKTTKNYIKRKIFTMENCHISVQWPVLFIIYVNEIPDSLQFFCKKFADDTKVYAALDKRSDQESLQ